MRIDVAQVCVQYDGRPILKDISATFMQSEVTALMGPSGSGKSTLLAAISGVTRIASGRITFSTGDRPRTEWLMQETPLLQRRLAIDNVLLSSRIIGLSDRAAFAGAFRAMKSLGILHLANKQTHLLSGGEKQRVAVARAIASRAQIILADEPTASLDSRSRDAVLDALDTAAKAGALIICATHDVTAAARATRVYNLRDGALEL